MRGLLKNLILSLVTIALLAVVLEASFRSYRYLKHQQSPFRRVGYTIHHPLLGWQGTKRFGDPSSEKPKVFFVGDSFTALWGKHKRRDMYYSVVERDLDIEVFVYGGGGYGTFQEYLAIDKYIDRVEPDLLVLQVTSNDFINNLWRLEKESYLHNHYMVRPYYEDGEVAYHFPRGSRFVREHIMPHSHLVYFIAFRKDRYLARRARAGLTETIESKIEAEGVELEIFREAVEVTAELVAKIKKRAEPAPVVAFPVFGNEPYFSEFEKIFAENEIRFIGDVPEVAWAAELEAHPRKLRDNDHWSDVGHQACGHHLSEVLREVLRDSPTGEGRERPAS
jgi:lysophospholipase L1-like esterase